MRCGSGDRRPLVKMVLLRNVALEQKKEAEPNGMAGPGRRYLLSPDGEITAL